MGGGVYAVESFRAEGGKVRADLRLLYKLKSGAISITPKKWLVETQKASITQARIAVVFRQEAQKAINRAK